MPSFRHHGAMRRGRRSSGVRRRYGGGRLQGGQVRSAGGAKGSREFPYSQRSRAAHRVPPFPPEPLFTRRASMRFPLAGRIVTPGLLVAKVDASRCTGCGLCASVCPTGAISVSLPAQVDATKCTGCGTCINHCPMGAISLE